MMLSFDPKKQLAQFLAEDIGRGDVTSALLPKKRITARIISREKAVVAGAAHARHLFGIMGCRARVLKKDGSRVRGGEAVMAISGEAKKILSCERTALNLMTRMSGIATQTAELVRMIPKGTRLHATRKTAPGLRYFDKEAVEIGGGHRHRMSLDEMVMIKDNHIAAGGPLESLISDAKKKHKRFEVEAESTQDAVMAAREGATIVMLDNFTPARIRRTITALRDQGLRDRILLEASGGISRRNIARYGQTGVDIISVGSITNSARGIDMSLEI